MITILITLIIIGVVLWLVNTKIPMDSTIKTIFNVVVILGACLWLLSVFGIIGPIPVPAFRNVR